MLRLSVRTGQDWAEGLEAEWDDLLSRDPQATPFQSRQWIMTWWSHFRAGKTPYTVTAHDNDRLVGLFPMFRGRAAWSPLRPMGVGPSDYLRVLAANEDVRKAILEHVHIHSGLVDLHQSVLDDPGAFEQAACLVVDLPSDFDAYISRLSKSLRYDVRRMDKIQDIEFVEDLPPSEALDILFELHKQRWRSRGLPGAFLGRVVNFQKAWFESSGDLASVTVLRWKGKSVGAIYTMHLGRTTYFYQAGFDPSASSISPGTLLVGYALKQAIERGDQAFDFCRGDEPYKRRWKPDRVVVNYRLLTSQSPLGRVGKRWNRFAWSIEERIRRRFEGGSLLPKGASKKVDAP